MSQHPRQDELLAHIVGDLSTERSAEVERHLLACPPCAHARAKANGLVTLVGEVDADLDQVDLVEVVVARAAAASPSRSRLAWPAWGFGLTAAAAVGVLAVIRPPSSADDAEEFRSKASPGVATADAWVGLQVFVAVGEGAPVPLANAIHSGDGLLFAYSNTGSTPQRYLMVFALGADRELYWYYPAFEDADSNPASVAIVDGSHIELGESIAHPLPPGPLSLMGLFTREPLRVAEIEQQVALEGRLADDLGGAEAARQRLWIDVLP